MNELGGYRRAEGRSTTPDFEEEDRLRADLNTSEAQKRQLGQDSRQLASLVLHLAAKQGSATASGIHAVQRTYGWTFLIKDLNLCDTLIMAV